MRDVDDRHFSGSFLRPSWIGVVILCGLAGFLTFSGTYNAVTGLPFWLGWCYWMLTLTVGCLVGYGVIVIFERWGANYFLRYGASILASTAAVTAVITTLQAIIGQPLSWSFIPSLFAQVLAISVLIFSIGLISERAKQAPGAKASPHEPVKDFLERLPLKYRDAELYAISSEDHYLRVHTSKGEELILMRLSDAVHALKEADGLRTHRSWWVASAAISDVKKENGRLELSLKSGALAPVSRTYQSAVKAANWF